MRPVSKPCTRDSDGLALSSRNLYLSADERRRALALPQALVSAQAALRAGKPVAETLATAHAQMTAAGFARVDYIQLVEGEGLDALDRVTPGARLMAAAVMGTTRLIDNLAV